MKRYLWSWYCKACDTVTFHLSIEQGTPVLNAAALMNDSHHSMNGECHRVNQSRYVEIIAVVADHAAVADV